MTPPTDPADHVRRALALADRNLWLTRIASLAGYAVWIVATFRFMHMAEQSGLPSEVVSLLRMGAFVFLFGGMATQFMVCNYINMMARRILHAVHMAQGAGSRANMRPPE